MKPYQAPFFMHIKFYLPEGANREKNSAHIRYIGTRPGVDRGVDLDAPEVAPIPGTAAHHVQYAHERPRSHGLFSSGDDEISLPDVQRELAEHNGIVWRMVLSLQGDDADRLGMNKREGWEEVIKSQMPQVAEAMGIPESNFRWVAAFHAEQGHPHAHVVFWEKKPKRRMGKVTPYVQSQLRKVFVKKIYRDDRDYYGKEKTAKREMFRELGLKTLREHVDYLRMFKREAAEVHQLEILAGQSRLEGVAPKFTVEQSRELAHRLQEAAKLLPGRGRLMMKFMPQELKTEIHQIAEWLYHQPQFQVVRHQYEKASEMLARPYTTKSDQLESAVERARADMIERLSQIVLRAVSEASKTNRFTIHPEKAAAVLERFSNATGKIEEVPLEQVSKIAAKHLRTAGLGKDLTSKVLRKLELPVDVSTLDRLYTTPVEANRVSKEAAYLLKAGIGAEEAAELMRKNGHTEQEIKRMHALQKTPTDEKSLRKVLRIPSLPQKSVEQMATVLLAAGANKDEVKRIIEQWNHTSSSHVSDETITKAMDKAEKIVQDTTDWGRTPLISRNDFNQLCKRLRIEAPYPWRSQKEYQRVRREHNVSIGQGVVRSAMGLFQSMSRKAEAERERAQRMAIRRIQINAEREEDERKNRGR